MSAASPKKITIGTPTSGVCIEKHFQCVMALVQALEEKGWEVTREEIVGSSLVDLARSVIATHSFRRKDDVLFWIDDDMIADTSELLPMIDECLKRKTIVGAVGVTKTMGAKLNIKPMPGDKKMRFGGGGSVQEVMAIGTGVCAVHRDVLQAMVTKRVVKECTSTDDKPFMPFYRNEVLDGFYHGEDMSFCWHAKKLGFKIYADSRVRTFHFGLHAFSFEETTQTTRYRSLDINFQAPPKDSKEEPKAKAAPLEAVG